MQNAIPAVPETTIATLIPEVVVKIGQNQIRRHIGRYTQNYQGQDVRTHNAYLDANQTLDLQFNIKAFVLSASAPVSVSMTYDSGAKGSVNQLLVWDQPITRLTLDNLGTERIQIQLAYIVEEPPSTGT